MNHYVNAVIRHLIEVNGHELVTDPLQADYLLISLRDITEIFELEKLRNTYPRTKIAVGGHLAVYFKLLALFADVVNVGQGFEFFRAQSENEILDLDCIYTPKDPDAMVVPSTFIEWSRLPASQVSKNVFYYLGAVGCRNKCKYCLTSWTNRYQRNDYTRIKTLEARIPKGKSLNLISNDNVKRNILNKTRVKDMMLRDFIRQREKDSTFVRMGLEFATEETRAKYGKPFTDEELLFALDHAKALNVQTQFFCITGLNTIEEWQHLFNQIPVDMDFRPRVFFKFTNLEYCMFTPIFDERYDLDPSRYCGQEFREKIFIGTSGKNKRIRTAAIKYPAHALWRMGMGGVVTMDQFLRWKKLKNKKDLQTVYQELYDTGTIDTDYRDQVQFWYQRELSHAQTG
jgi:hypothetical protein